MSVKNSIESSANRFIEHLKQGGDGSKILKSRNGTVVTVSQTGKSNKRDKVRIQAENSKSNQSLDVEVTRAAARRLFTEAGGKDLARELFNKPEELKSMLTNIDAIVRGLHPQYKSGSYIQANDIQDMKKAGTLEPVVKACMDHNPTWPAGSLRSRSLAKAGENELALYAAKRAIAEGGEYLIHPELIDQLTANGDYAKAYGKAVRRGKLTPSYANSDPEKHKKWLARGYDWAITPLRWKDQSAPANVQFGPAFNILGAQDPKTLDLAEEMISTTKTVFTPESEVRHALQRQGRYLPALYRQRDELGVNYTGEHIRIAEQEYRNMQNLDHS